MPGTDPQPTAHHPAAHRAQLRRWTCRDLTLDVARGHDLAGQSPRSGGGSDRHLTREPGAREGHWCDLQARAGVLKRWGLATDRTLQITRDLPCPVTCDCHRAGADRAPCLPGRVQSPFPPCPGPKAEAPTVPEGTTCQGQSAIALGHSAGVPIRSPVSAAWNTTALLQRCSMQRHSRPTESAVKRF